MFPFLFLVLFISVPLAEIAVFIEVGGWIGLWPTIGVVIITALLGTALLRSQGLSTLRKVQMQLDQNQLPVREMFDGLCLLVAGALLLTPGFVTDGVGFLLFVPPFRATLAALMMKTLAKRGSVHMHSMGNQQTAWHQERTDPRFRTEASSTHQHTAASGAGHGPIIDGEFEDLDPKSDAPDGETPKLSKPDSKQDP